MKLERDAVFSKKSFPNKFLKIGMTQSTRNHQKIGEFELTEKKIWANTRIKISIKPNKQEIKLGSFDGFLIFFVEIIRKKTCCWIVGSVEEKQTEHFLASKRKFSNRRRRLLFKIPQYKF